MVDDLDVSAGLRPLPGTGGVDTAVASTNYARPVTANRSIDVLGRRGVAMSTVEVKVVLRPTPLNNEAIVERPRAVLEPMVRVPGLVLAGARGGGTSELKGNLAAAQIVG